MDELDRAFEWKNVRYRGGAHAGNATMGTGVALMNKPTWGAIFFHVDVDLHPYGANKQLLSLVASDLTLFFLTYTFEVG